MTLCIAHVLAQCVSHHNHSEEAEEAEDRRLSGERIRKDEVCSRRWALRWWVRTLWQWLAFMHGRLLWACERAAICGGLCGFSGFGAHATLTVHSLAVEEGSESCWR